MRKNRAEICLAIFIIAVIAGTAFLYLQTQEKNTSGMFPERLGNMSIALHSEGNVAVREIKSSHSANDNVDPEEAHIARYRNSSGNRAKNNLVIWIAISNPDKTYQSMLMDEALKSIGG